MTEENYRWQRIDRLFHELRYEIERGMIEGEIDESICFRFVVPISKAIPNGVVLCEFRSRPRPRYEISFDEGSTAPHLKVIK